MFELTFLWKHLGVPIELQPTRLFVNVWLIIVLFKCLKQKELRIL